jgi:hypothetical protein
MYQATGATMTDPAAVDSKVFVQSILGHTVVCTLSDGRTATGRLVCVDRLYVVCLRCRAPTFVFESLVTHDASLHSL